MTYTATYTCCYCGNVLSTITIRAFQSDEVMREVPLECDCPSSLLDRRLTRLEQKIGEAY